MRSRLVWGMSSRFPGWAACSLLWVALVLVCAPIAGAKVFLSQDEALELAFPGADRVEEEVFILTSVQKQAIEKLSRTELESELATFYSGFKGEELLGYAFIDIHTVRTLPEAFMVVLEPDGSVRSLHVLAFYEPTDYMPTKRWYRQFNGKSLSDSMRVGRDVHGVVGATLSTHAVARSVRKVLATYEVLIASPGRKPAQ
jgi:transcriptional regulator of nitric oxide reductase